MVAIRDVVSELVKVKLLGITYSVWDEDTVLLQFERSVEILLDTRCGSTNITDRQPSNIMETDSKEIPICRRGRRPSYQWIEM